MVRITSFLGYSDTNDSNFSRIVLCEDSELEIVWETLIMKCHTSYLLVPSLSPILILLYQDHPISTRVQDGPILTGYEWETLSKKHDYVERQLVVRENTVKKKPKVCGNTRNRKSTFSPWKHMKKIFTPVCGGGPNLNNCLHQMSITCLHRLAINIIH